MKHIYILGTGLSHNGSSCLMKDGKIIVAIEKERITRKKHDGYNDNYTIQYCLDYEGITMEDISLIVEEGTYSEEHDFEDIEKRKGRIIPKDVPRISISHHLAHAYSAVGTSPFDDQAVVVMDGFGSNLKSCIEDLSNCLPNDINELEESQYVHYFETESYYLFKDNKMIPIFKDFSRYTRPDRCINPVAPVEMEKSVAGFYGGVSYFVFDRYYCEGKLMGLAPYSKSPIINDSAFILKENRAFINYDVMEKFRDVKRNKMSFWDDFIYFADVASWAQRETERATQYLINSYHDIYPHSNLSFAGGLGLNAVSNSKTLRNCKFKDYYFQPAAGDNGLSIGCCFYGWLEVMGKKKVKQIYDSCYGKEYEEVEIIEALEKYSNNIVFEKKTDYIKIAANHIVNGKVVAWFQGASEFGPRALGHRSLLASPVIPEMKDYINKEIKLREEFRPFAPSVLLDDADLYFDTKGIESPYMILTANTNESIINDIPSVVHVDGSARIQTVDKKVSPIYYSLLKELGELSGIPIVLNTSLNCAGMPIVESPEDVLSFFCDSSIDILFLDDYVIKKK